MSELSPQPPSPSPITAAPKRSINDFPVSPSAAIVASQTIVPSVISHTLANNHNYFNNSESCKNTPNISRKLEPHHHALLESGSQSAKSSPLPQRRLDKLEGVIRDVKPSPIHVRRKRHIDLIHDDNTINSISNESSPIEIRKLNGNHYIYEHQQKINNTVNACLDNCGERRNTDCSGCLNKKIVPSSPSIRRRAESDCSCKNINNLCSTTQQQQQQQLLLHQQRQIQQKKYFTSSIQSVLGEPGCFSSPVHQRLTVTCTTATNNYEPSFINNISSPKSCVTEECGKFASTIRSKSPCTDDDNNTVLEISHQTDQTIVSGWLKFRDNKRWKIRWGVVTKLSPAADCLHLQLYRDSKDRYKHNQTKASLSLQQFLGIESGFTLDKESNTIAIICQDVIVVLAFDTRERLIQWQVKISNNLGDDIQYLVLVSSTPPKSKLSNGPSRMHVQDNRFCLTTGVPPKLAGLWDIGYLRRYGVIDGRFCFEGGSRCGKGEGLYVFVTDQGDEITHTLKLASQGKLSTKRRAINRKMSALESPRKSQLSQRSSDILNVNNSNNNNNNNNNINNSNSHQTDENCSVVGHLDDDTSTTHTCVCNNNNRMSYWPSQESRDIDSNYGCGDTVSVSERNDSFNDNDNFPRNSVGTMERCMSCISKLGALSMSRSSTATGVGTPITGQPQNWQLLSEQNSIQNQLHYTAQQHQHILSTNKLSTATLPPSTIKFNPCPLDRMSVCSSHGSYTSSSSEYTVPQSICNLTQCHESWYERVENASPQQQSCNSHRASSPCQCCPPRPPKPTKSNVKPLLPLTLKKSLQPNQINAGTTVANSPTQYCGPYEDYDVPKIPIQVESNFGTENYDTPKKIQEYLIKDVMNSSSSCNNDSNNNYGNYDMPANIANMCGCLSTTTNDSKQLNYDNILNNGGLRPDCTCLKVMSWADNWISLPYCRRGNSIENTGVPINKVKLSGEGKMPVVQPSGELAIYATVDMSKKVNRRLLDGQSECDCHIDENENCNVNDADNKLNFTNYMNFTQTNDLSTDTKNSNDSDSICDSSNPLNNNNDDKTASSVTPTTKNYMNLEFAMSLENYENAKEVLQRAGFSVGTIEETLKTEIPHTKICYKCGHVCNTNKNRLQNTKQNNATTLNNQEQQPQHQQQQKQQQHQTLHQKEKPENYVLMEPSNCKKMETHFPGYLPMAPAPPAPIANSQQQLQQQLSSASTETIAPSGCQYGPMSPPLQPPPLPLKTELMKRMIGEKSASNPSLCGPAVDRSRKRAEQEARIPGSAMMLLHKSGGSPYTRKQLMDNSDLLPIDKRLTARKRSSSADSSRFLEDPDEFESSETIRKTPLGEHAEGRRSSSPCLHQETEPCHIENSITNQPYAEQSIETDNDDVSLISTTQISQCNSQSPSSTTAVHIRRSASVPCKGGQPHQQQNRDSSSSNDSGVSTGSTRHHHRPHEFTDFELPLTTAMSTRRHQKHFIQSINNHTRGNNTACVHASLPRRSKSFDPLREITFQFQKIKIPEKSTSAEAEIPICPPKLNNNLNNIGNRGNITSPNEPQLIAGPPYIDSRSTSSGTSDMSDYIETLSLSSHSSSDTPDGLRLIRQATSTLRPRSGKEYHNIDRSMLTLQQSTGPDGKLTTSTTPSSLQTQSILTTSTPSQLRELKSYSVNYANITPVPEHAESPSPGYQSGGSPQEQQQETFMFKN